MGKIKRSMAANCVQQTLAAFAATLISVYTLQFFHRRLPVSQRRTECIAHWRQMCLRLAVSCSEDE